MDSNQQSNIDLDLDFFQSSLDTFTQSFDEFSSNSSQNNAVDTDTQISRDWTASSLGIASETLETLQVTSLMYNAYPGTYFKTQLFDRAEVAIRSDRLQLYLCKTPSLNDFKIIVETLIKDYQVKCAPVATLKERFNKSQENKWILLAGPEIKEHSDNDPSNSTPFFLEDFNLIDSRSKYLKVKELCLKEHQRLESINLIAVAPGAKLIEDRQSLLSSMHQDIFGNQINTDTHKQINLGEGLERKSNGLIHVKEYGYLVSTQNELKIKTPFVFNSDRSQCKWLLLGKHLSTPSIDIIYKSLNNLGITNGIQTETIQDLLNNQQSFVINSFQTVAKSTEPVKGEDSHLEFLNFDQKNSDPIEVKKGTLIAIKHPASAGEPGYDIFGNIIEQKHGKDIPIKHNHNIQSKENGILIEYIALTDGILHIENQTLSLTELLTIDSDVDYNTGNISFPGSVLIKGSITNGFKVEAKENITVMGTLENGASITCFGNLTVKLGIVGLKTRVLVKGDLSAKFIQEASVTVHGNIEVLDHVYHAKVRSEKVVSIRRLPQSQRGGSAIGGFTWGVLGVDLHFAGAQNNPETIIGTGVDTALNQEMSKSQALANEHHKQILYLKKLCNLSSIQEDEIDSALAESMSQDNQKLVRYLKRLIEVIQSYKILIHKMKDRRETVQCAENQINLNIRNRCFPKVTFFHGQQNLFIAKEKFSPQFTFKDNIFGLS